MKRLILKKLLPIPTAFALFFTISLTTRAEENGFHVQNGCILEYNGSMFVARGVNFPYSWFRQNWNSSVAGIAATGSNCVRVVLSNGRRWNKTSASEVRQIIQKCKDNELIAILEVHDCTGYSEQQGSVPLSTAVDYWKEIKSALDGQEKYVWINIANEPFGNDKGVSDWVNEHKDAITELRAAGFQHMLVVDGPNWGQDHTNTMSSRASLVLDADELNRTVLSVHMYQVYDSDSKINAYMEKFHNKQWPLIVGEFAADHGSYGDVDEKAILKRAEEYNFGYIGWSWAGNGMGLGSLDITNNFNASSLTGWGNTLVHDEFGIKKTSKKASVYSGEFNEPPVTVTASSRERHASPLTISQSSGGLAHLSFPSGQTLSTVEVFTLKGTHISVISPERSASDKAVILNMRSLTPGNYLIRCTTNTAEYRKMITIQGF